MSDTDRGQAFIASLNFLNMAPDELAHHGVLGMHWGVTRERARSGDRRAQRQLAKGDKKWEKELNSTKGFIKVNNAMADKMNGPNGHIAKFNARYSDDVDYTKDSPAARKYYSDYSKMANTVFKETVLELYGESPSGSKKLEINFDPATNAPLLKVVEEGLSHADVDMVMTLKTDNKGRIIALDSILAHYGVLGMHWGVRKPESVARDSREDRHISNTRRKLAVGTLGASVYVPKLHRAVLAKRAAARARLSQDHLDTQALRKKKASELTTKEMQQVIDRLQKEDKLKKLDPNELAIAKKVVMGVVAGAGVGITIYNMANSPAGKAAIINGKRIIQQIINR